MSSDLQQALIPILVALWCIAGALVWCAIIDITQDAPAAIQRPIGGQLAAARARRGRCASPAFGGAWGNWVVTTPPGEQMYRTLTPVASPWQRPVTTRPWGTTLFPAPFEDPPAPFCGPQPPDTRELEIIGAPS